MIVSPISTSRVASFVGGDTGSWLVDRTDCLCGEALPPAARVAVFATQVDLLELTTSAWVLSGTTSNDRYVVRAEKSALGAKQEGLGRSPSTRAALIPIRKNAEWWLLAQDERRHILEEQSNHIKVGMKYLPAIARRLHHCRDMNVSAPFDFLTWFEYAPEHTNAFDDLLAALRSSPEWLYVDREVDVRLVRDGGQRSDVA